jgi:hypothetical protein
VKLPVLCRPSSWLAVCGDGSVGPNAAEEHALAAGRRLPVRATVVTTPDHARLVVLTRAPWPAGRRRRVHRWPSSVTCEGWSVRVAKQPSRRSRKYGKTQTARHQRRDQNGSWLPSMEAVLTKVS